MKVTWKVDSPLYVLSERLPAIQKNVLLQNYFVAIDFGLGNFGYVIGAWKKYDWHFAHEFLSQ
jgi:hypothetical protein